MKNFFSFFCCFLISCLFFSQIIFAENISFSDVFPNDPLNTESTLNYLVNANIIKGYDDGTFRPLQFINRAEFTKIIVSANGLDVTQKEYTPCFTDTPRWEWYTPYICEAYEQGWVKGFSDNLFHPEETLSLAESLSILSKAFDWELKTPASIRQMPYQDVNNTDWSLPYLDYAKKNLILQELNRYISPQHILNRKEAIQYLYRTILLNKGEKITWNKTGNDDQSYQEILATAVKPAIPIDFDFPHQSQAGYPYACFGFSAINLTNYKYNLGLQVEDMASNIGWDKNGIWNDEEFDGFAKYYHTDVIFTYYASPAYVFEKLKNGEPVVMYRYYYINGENVGHQAVAFSFDDQGIYFGDSANDSVQRIPYEDLFKEEWNNGKTLNVFEFREVKGEGQKKE
ncbi:MAG: S-layer protein [Candidatus Peregrinibacteria bacterium GW2011_GWF2_33_10]|nr:MAG: S-layer protein [Candidatus Peregrinibacteria bacterium GW2011_GWF2_33_10]OGJ45247.1 MAG: hypothetical protein A2263_06775 [Candidatus Peregrinibacteria bacterium RIFOXYA2_FULL_33_21]OGJ51171.1 MAG: hypothetical protein A2307_04860 [Candidatus Peregrinibacteria bacterium RIFOXYB2_FULL_33_20]